MPHPAVAQIRFEEIAKKAGLDFRLRNAASGRFHQVELMPGGVAAFDFDNDGLCDIFVAGVNRNILYRNLGDSRFADVTAKAELSGIDPKRGKTPHR